MYRYEKSGVVHGLLRARGFTQDDSHIFCTHEQLAGRAGQPAGIRDRPAARLRLRPSSRPSWRPGPRSSSASRPIGTEATEALRNAIEAAGLPYVVAEGEGAFYGPKIDVHVRDAIGRRWQLSTLQVDFQMPERFELEYIGADNQRHRPIMIHRALFGSIERFFGVLLEHYAGAFPLAGAGAGAGAARARRPRGLRRGVAERLRDAGFRVDTAEADEPLGARIRKAKLEKLPYVLVVGDDDVAAGTVGVNARGGEVERGVATQAFIERLRAEKR